MPTNIIAMRRCLLLSVIQKRFLQTSSASSSSTSFTVQFLVDSCGLPLQSALLVSRKFQIDENNLHKPQSIIQFFKSHDFEDAHIAKTIEKWPTALHSKIEDNLKPKFDFFIRNGFVGKLLPQLIASNPEILSRSLDSQIKPCLEFLKPFLDSHEKLLLAIKRAPWLLFSLKIAVRPNIDFLIKEGVPSDRIAKLILWQPRAVLQKYGKMVDAVSAAKNLGLQPKDNMFIRALSVLVQASESTRRKKFQVMRSLGWSEDEIWSAFKRYPPLLASSEERIRVSMDFFMNTMELEKTIIIAYPYLLGFSIDKRIRPRYNVVKVLESRKLIKKDPKIVNLLIMSEEKFLLNYVTNYGDKVPDLLQIYGGANKLKRVHT